MTVEERLDALTQTVELLAGMMRASEARIDKILAAIDKDAENIRALARIAESREHRLSM